MLALLLAATAFAGQDITLKTADGVSVHAIAAAAKGAKRGVVLVHMAGREAEDWRFLADKLSRSDMSVIAPDLRGHGKNVPEDQDEPDLTDSDYQAMVGELNASIKWLRDQGVTEVSCGGASVGANLCLTAASNDEEIVNLVLLSPGLKYKGVATPSAMDTYGNRPVLLVASEDDSYSFRSATVLEGKAHGQKHFEILNKAGHGTKMLNRDPSLEGLVTSWLLGSYKLSTGEVVAPRPKTADTVGTVETTGEMLDAHK
jgi:alpha-beta hydrolase superfamily lysophospholipase